MSSLSVGIVGLPNVGKSTLFNALVKQELAKVDFHPFTTIKPNVGVISVPDERLDKLVGMIKKTTTPGVSLSTPGVEGVEARPATVKFIDIAGLVKGAAQGEGLGNQFLAHIREVDVICFVLRDFEDEKVAKIGKNPKEDLETLKTELILKDLETIEKVQSSKPSTRAQAEGFKVQSLAQSAKLEINELRNKLLESLNKGLMVNQIDLDREDKELVKEWCLLTNKPYFVVLNVAENDLLEIESKIKSYKDWTVIPICAKLEEQLLGLLEDEQREYLQSVGLQKSGLEGLMRTAYNHLGLITFYTVKGRKEISAWPIKEGSVALQAAGIIHTDFAKKFIKAEVINWEKLLKAGSWRQAAEKGWLSLQGRDYQVKDGDVIEFKLNV